MPYMKSTYVEFNKGKIKESDIHSDGLFKLLDDIEEEYMTFVAHAKAKGLVYVRYDNLMTFLSHIRMIDPLINLNYIDVINGSEPFSHKEKLKFIRYAVGTIINDLQLGKQFVSKDFSNELQHDVDYNTKKFFDMFNRYNYDHAPDDSLHPITYAELRIHIDTINQTIVNLQDMIREGWIYHCRMNDEEHYQRYRYFLDLIRDIAESILKPMVVLFRRLVLNK